MNGTGGSGSIQERLTEEVMRELMRQGLTDVQIGALYGCTYQNIQRIRRGYHLPRTKRGNARVESRTLPWEVRGNSNNDKITTVLRSYLRRESNEQIPETEHRRVDKFVEQMKRLNLVVDYRDGDWVTRTRRPTDGDLPYRKP